MIKMHHLVSFTKFNTLNEMAQAVSRGIDPKNLRKLEVESHLNTPVSEDDGQPKAHFTTKDLTIDLYDTNNRDAETGFFLADRTTNTIIGYIVLQPKKICSMNVWKILLVKVTDKYQGKGIAPALYNTLLNYKPIISDEIHYPDGRKLWAKLSQNPLYTVAAIDPSQCKILAKDIQIIQTNDPKQFDPRFYSDDESKKNIVFLLRKAK